jgi:hypothetical protein
MPGIPYDAILGVSELTNGIVFQLTRRQAVGFSAVFKKTIEFLQFGISEITNYGSDGTNTYFTIRAAFNANSPIELSAATGDEISITLSDDLSGLLWFRWAINVRQRAI